MLFIIFKTLSGGSGALIDRSSSLVNFLYGLVKKLVLCYFLYQSKIIIAKIKSKIVIHVS